MDLRRFDDDYSFVRATGLPAHIVSVYMAVYS